MRHKVADRRQMNGWLIVSVIVTCGLSVVGGGGAEGDDSRPLTPRLVESGRHTYRHQGGRVSSLLSAAYSHQPFETLFPRFLGRLIL